MLNLGELDVDDEDLPAFELFLIKRYVTVTDVPAPRGDLAGPRPLENATSGCLKLWPLA